MAASHMVSGFSKFSRTEKLKWLKEQSNLSDKTLQMIHSHIHPDKALQEIYSDISENTISNFYLPLGLAPNFVINGEPFTIPMVSEESSVVAAASHAAKFWAMNGGFLCEVKDMLKTGQVHFTWSGDQKELYSAFEKGKSTLLQSVSPLTANMRTRGGGIESIEIRKTSALLPGTYQLFITFRTADAMGANFINSVLEAMAQAFRKLMKPCGGKLEVIMAILSNYTPECLVSCSIEADQRAFNAFSDEMTGAEFSAKFTRAVEIACQDPYRAVTHNKGIFNGMDAVLVATGNDYRAVEASGHAYASKDGRYSSLSRAAFSKGILSLTLEVPLAVGTVGGLTGTHPLAASAMEILGHPSSEQLMQIVAAAGLASNFSAVRSLVTTGIQQGHMKMHLGNILRQMNASREETALASEHFKQKTVSYSEVAAHLELLRNKPNKP